MEDYAARKEMSVEDVEQWLGSRLNSEPGDLATTDTQEQSGEERAAVAA